MLPFVLMLSSVDDDDDDDDEELFLWYGWPTKGVYTLFQPGPLSEILTIANLRHAASRVWTCAESEFRLCGMKLCSSDNHYTTAPQVFGKLLLCSSCPKCLAKKMFCKLFQFLQILLSGRFIECRATKHLNIK